MKCVGSHCGNQQHGDVETFTAACLYGTFRMLAALAAQHGLQLRLSSVLEALLRGSAAAPSGWTYQHIRSAAGASQSCHEAVCSLLKAVISETLPRLSQLLVSTLSSFEKPNGGL